MITRTLGPNEVLQAAEILRAGGLVAFPTETVYGLGADACNDQAVGRIFTVKGRPADNPLIVHVHSLEQAQIYGDLGAEAHELAQCFWPGPLTLVVRSTGPIAATARAGLPSVALRCPDHPVAQALLMACACPLAAPSANRSGRLSPTTASDVLEDLSGRIDAVLDGGRCRIGVESTVLDLTRDTPCLLRPGGLPIEAIEEVLGPVRRGGIPGQAPASPGMRYRHYAPSTPVLVVDGGTAAVSAALRLHPGAAVFCSRETACALGLHDMGAYLAIGGGQAEQSRAARELFGALRRLDRLRPTVIIAEAISEQGVGVAVMDRLRRAAEGR